MGKDTSSSALAIRVTPKKSTTSMKNKEPKKNPTHPKTSEMVTAAIANLKERGGSSLQAIKKYITGTYQLNSEKHARFIRKYLKSAVEKGELIQTKGTGASGSFKLGTAAKSSSAVKPKAAAKPKSLSKKSANSKKEKPATKKITPDEKAAVAKKSPTKKTASKKKIPAEKKVTIEKKAAKAVMAKKPAAKKSPVKKTTKAFTAKPKTPKPKKATKTTKK